MVSLREERNNRNIDIFIKNKIYGNLKRKEKQL